VRTAWGLNSSSNILLSLNNHNSEVFSAKGDRICYFGNNARINSETGNISTSGSITCNSIIGNIDPLPFRENIGFDNGEGAVWGSNSCKIAGNSINNNITLTGALINCPQTSIISQTSPPLFIQRNAPNTNNVSWNVLELCSNKPSGNLQNGLGTAIVFSSDSNTVGQNKVSHAQLTTRLTDGEDNTSELLISPFNTGTPRNFIFKGKSGNLDISSGANYQINNVNILSSTTLGSSVINSSLTSVGTLTGLNVLGVNTSNITKQVSDSNVGNDLLVLTSESINAPIGEGFGSQIKFDAFVSNTTTRTNQVILKSEYLNAGIGSSVFNIILNDSGSPISYLFGSSTFNIPVNINNGLNNITTNDISCSNLSSSNLITANGDFRIATDKKIIWGTPSPNNAYETYYSSPNLNYNNLNILGEHIFRCNNIAAFNIEPTICNSFQLMRCRNRLRINNSAVGLGSQLLIGGNDEVIIAASSKRYKKDIEPINIDLNLLDKIQSVKFKYINNDTSDIYISDIGLIAEDLYEILDEDLKCLIIKKKYKLNNISNNNDPDYEYKNKDNDISNNNDPDYEYKNKDNDYEYKNKDNDNEYTGPYEEKIESINYNAFHSIHLNLMKQLKQKINNLETEKLQLNNDIQILKTQNLQLNNDIQILKTENLNLYSLINEINNKLNTLNNIINT